MLPPDQDSAIGKPSPLDRRDDCPRGYHLLHRPQFRSCRRNRRTSAVLRVGFNFRQKGFRLTRSARASESVQVPNGGTATDFDDVNIRRLTLPLFPLIRSIYLLSQ